ncbi:MAG: hypothetical protein HUU15_04415 [Candidatus Brocadiae bacterium]|nr:hypothetical protein [Candidatus Brocadiia bacterium]
MTTLRILLTVLFAAGVACADEIDDQVAALVKKLGDDAWEVREQAQKDLVALGVDARVAMQAALDASTDAEVRVLLRQALERIGKVRWAAGVKAAIEEAGRRGVGILVVVADGPQGDARSKAGVELRRVLEAPSFAAELNRKFVLVWWNAEFPGIPDDRGAGGASVEGDAGPAGAMGVYFCAARGSVRHFLPGWWRETTLREEIARIDPLLKASDASEGLKLRAALQRAIAEEARRLEEANPEEMKKPPAESEIHRDVLRRQRLVAAWQAGEEATGEPVESYLLNRMKDMKARWGGGPR